MTQAMGNSKKRLAHPKATATLESVEGLNINEVSFNYAVLCWGEAPPYENPYPSALDQSTRGVMHEGCLGKHFCFAIRSSRSLLLSV